MRLGVASGPRLRIIRRASERLGPVQGEARQLGPLEPLRDAAHHVHLPVSASACTVRHAALDKNLN
jgi:hypothetical protein